MVTLEQALDWLRMPPDFGSGDIVEGLLQAIPDYIDITTGMSVEQQKDEPLVDTVTKFLLMLWYDAQQPDAAQLQRTIDNLLKTLTVKARGYENRSIDGKGAEKEKPLTYLERAEARARARKQKERSLTTIIELNP